MRKHCVSYVRVKKYLMAAFIKMNILVFLPTLLYLSLTLLIWLQIIIETANSKVLLFIVASGIALIEYEILNPKKGTTKVAVSKL